MAKSTAAHTKGETPRIQFTPEYPEAARIIKHMIGLARTRGDSKEALYLFEARKKFLNWIEDRRAEEAAENRMAKKAKEEADRKALIERRERAEQSERNLNKIAQPPAEQIAAKPEA